MTATKPSGIAWIGDIPYEWNVNEIRYMFVPINKPNRKMAETNLLSLSYGRIVQRDIEAAQGLLPESFDGYNIIEDGDIVLRLTDLQNDQRSLRVGFSTQRGIITSAYLTMRLQKSKYDPRYYYYLLHDYDLQKVFYGMGAGVRQGLNFEELKRVSVLLPPFTEQQAIATFLDDRCGQIDGIIADLERQVEILRQYKKALITETVTKGLDKTVPMKDSGIDWIGEMPRHWDVKRLRYVCRLKTGTTPSENEGINTDELGLNWFTPSDFSPSLTLEASEKYVSSEAIRRFKITPYPAASVLLVAIGATVGKIGYCEVPSYSNQQITALMPYGIRGKYLMYFLHSKTDYIKDNALYTTLPIINNTYLSDIFVCVPSDTEQTDMIDFLDRKCAETDDLIAEKQKAAEVMRQYKKSLIYEYVTGKKRVAGGGAAQ
jgi:type I restriction enzyme S subunit